MENIFTDADAWYDHYESIENLDEQIAFYHETFDKIEDVVANDFDDVIVEGIFDIIEKLTTDKKNDALETFIDTIREKQAPFYKLQFHYFIKDLLTYYLHIGNDEKAKFYLNDFIANPDSDIDIYLSINGLIGLYGKDDWTKELVEQYFAKPQDDKGYSVSSVKRSLATAIQPVITQKYYLLAQETGIFDYEQWNEDLKPYSIDFDEIKNLVCPLFEAKYYKDVILLDIEDNYYALQIHFLFARYMKEELDMPFSASYPMAKLYVEYWLGLKKQKSFVLDSELYREHLNDQTDFLDFYSYQLYVGAFGVVYFYDFLLAMEIIDEELHSSAIAISHGLKKELLKGSDLAWQNNGFIKKWKKPTAYSVEEFQEVLDHVETSLTDNTERKAGESFFRFETKRLKNPINVRSFFDAPREIGAIAGSNVQRKKPERKKKAKPKPKNKKKKK